MRRVGFFFHFCHLSQKKNTVSLNVCLLGRYGLYVESIFSHCLAVLSVFLALVVTVCVLPQLAISEHCTVNLHKSLIGALSFNFSRHRQLRRLCVAFFIFFEGSGNFLKTILSCVGFASSLTKLWSAACWLV
jgi:hypothetical protein